ncbi:MAG: hypothetical protein QOJ06_10 [Pseudonocardiales bacterium]|jgi:hypothetical protein|nr:hypothetical protein [Pseudonocardiales bacterium]
MLANEETIQASVGHHAGRYSHVICRINHHSRASRLGLLDRSRCSFIAIVTVTSALEPFFAWRFRWMLMEAAQYDFYGIGDEL